ncbi:MAG: IPTL-CTERM sorting domain-containing protein [Deltaproteobacteria bacterium]|nr:IPTL-CTERM sorting domain-containing protein [Deltaproteobacteria bacterium]
MGDCDGFEFPVSAVPTLSEWGLIAMAGILGIVGFVVMRRRAVVNS